MKYKILNIILENIEKGNKNFYPIRKIYFYISNEYVDFNSPDKNEISSFLRSSLKGKDKRKFHFDKVFFSFKNFDVHYENDCFSMWVRKDLSKESIKSIIKSFEPILGQPVKNKDLSLSIVDMRFCRGRIKELVMEYKLKKGTLEIHNNNFVNEYVGIELRKGMVNFLNQLLFHLRIENSFKIESFNDVRIKKEYETGEIYIDANVYSDPIQGKLEERKNIMNFKIKYGCFFNFRK